MICWNCGNDEILPRPDGIKDHPKAGPGSYICGRCGAAGDAEDFRPSPGIWTCRWCGVTEDTDTPHRTFGSRSYHLTCYDEMVEAAIDLTIEEARLA